MENTYDSRLSVRTRPNTSEYQKSKVMLVMHPDDRSRYQNEITEDILKHSDCAVYTLKPDAERRMANGDEPSKPHISDLREMRIVVAVITERFLSASSFAKDTQVKNALDNNIAVLPIMVESGLVKMFNSGLTFGGMQFLDKTSADRTEISYDDKLKSYLDKVLVTQTDVNNIKIHHKGHAFLSYRKKDREHAKRLMKALHDVRQDIAIWYDEFLTPGKHFDREIEERIIESDIFAMSMTPYMLEKPNYVEECEYKAAVDHKKTILPVELLDMGNADIEDTYPGIGNRLKYDDSTGITEFFGEHESKFLGYRGNQNTAEYLYYIALGFLNGIEAEVDCERASDILKKAARLKESKFSKEALRKLVFMYSNGAGVEKDRGAAVDFQADLVLLSDSEFRKNSTIENLADLINESVFYGDLFYDDGCYAMAETHYKNICEIIEQAMIEPDTALCALIWENATRGFVRLALMYVKRGDDAQARKYSKKGEEIDRKISKATLKLIRRRKDRTIMAMRYDAVKNEQLAFSARNDGEHLKAIGYMLENVEIENRLIKMTAKTPKAKEFRSASLAAITGWYSRAANLAIEICHYYDAEKYCTNSISAFEELGGKVKLLGDPDVQGELFWTYFHLSKVAEYRGDLIARRDALKKAYDVLTEITEQKGTEKWNAYLFRISGQLEIAERQIRYYSDGYVADPGTEGDNPYSGYVSLTREYENAVELFKGKDLQKAKDAFEKLYQRMKDKDYEEDLDDLSFSMSSIKSYLFMINAQIK